LISFRFVSFLLISFRFRWFRFALYRCPYLYRWFLIDYYGGGGYHTCVNYVVAIITLLPVFLT
jgi:hypothetical protein